MSNIPTKDEFEDLLLSMYGGKLDEKQLTEMMAQNVKPLFRVASKSDRMKAVAGGIMPQLLTSLTAGGINLGPTLACLMLGFHMGQTFAMRNVIPSAAHDEFADYMKGLILEEPEGE